MQVSVCTRPGVKYLLAEYRCVTVDVCKHICLELEKSCQSINYHRKRRSCRLSAFSHEEPVATLRKNPDSDYYHRQRCEGKELGNLIVVIFSALSWPRCDYPLLSGATDTCLTYLVWDSNLDSDERQWQCPRPVGYQGRPSVVRVGEWPVAKP